MQNRQSLIAIVLLVPTCKPLSFYSRERPLPGASRVSLIRASAPSFLPPSPGESAALAGSLARSTEIVQLDYESFGRPFPGELRRELLRCAFIGQTPHAHPVEVACRSIEILQEDRITGLELSP